MVEGSTRGEAEGEEEEKDVGGEGARERGKEGEREKRGRASSEEKEEEERAARRGIGVQDERSQKGRTVRGTVVKDSEDTQDAKVTSSGTWVVLFSLVRRPLLFALAFLHNCPSGPSSALLAGAIGCILSNHARQICAAHLETPRVPG